MQYTDYIHHCKSDFYEVLILLSSFSSRFLLGTSHIILDEIHERDVLSDFLLIIVRDLLPKR